MKVKIKLNGQDLPVRKGAMYDLSTAEDSRIEAGDLKLIKLGVCMELPKGYHAKLYPRSSTYKKWKILMANGIGIIDNKYCGDGDIWQFPALAVEDTFIPKNTRIAQFEICADQEPIDFEEVEMLGNRDRGGIGSTGN